MAEFDEVQLDAEFAAYRTALLPAIAPDGPASVRQTVRRRRRRTAVAVAAALVVAVAVPVAGEAGLRETGTACDVDDGFTGPVRVPVADAQRLPFPGGTGRTDRARRVARRHRRPAELGRPARTRRTASSVTPVGSGSAVTR